MIPQMKVVGVGGSGSNTVSRMAKFQMQGVELIALNTDAQALQVTKADKKILIGKQVTKGLGAGMEPESGRLAAEETRKEIAEAINGTDLLFITCGLGGGTGSGAAPVVAEIAKGMGILTIAVVTKPFSFEGQERKKIAQAALEKLETEVDSLLVISNDNLLKMINEKTTVTEAFEWCDSVLHEAVQGITDLIFVPGIINIDFASVMNLMRNSGKTLFGTGKASGEHRIVKAAEAAINSPLLNFPMHGAGGVLFNVSGQDVALKEVQEAAGIITKHAAPRAQIIFGAVKDMNLKKGEIKITVIATQLTAA
jgi:cell division protein FtsZ